MRITTRCPVAARTYAKKHSILDDYNILWASKLGTGINGEVVYAVVLSRAAHCRVCERRTDREKFALKCLRDRDESKREVGRTACG